MEGKRETEYIFLCFFEKKWALKALVERPDIVCFSLSLILNWKMLADVYARWQFLI